MSTTSSWMLLLSAGIFEILWTIGLKYSEGMSRLLPTLFTVICLTLSMYLLARASEGIPIGTAYSIWVGIGALGASILGILLFKEPVNPWKLVFILNLLISIIGIKIKS